MNALANEEVGNYLNKHFCSAYQKVGTFRIVNGQKQGGNVASYFCQADGTVLHAIAGPVDAATFLREARWAVETRKKAILDSRGDKRRTPYLIRAAHQERLANEFGVQINFNRINSNTPVEKFADYIPYYLAYSRGSGNNYAVAKGGCGGGCGGCWGAGGRIDVATGKVIAASAAGNGNGNATKVHMLLGMYPLAKIDRLYKSVWEKILNEKVSVLPVAKN